MLFCDNLISDKTIEPPPLPSTTAAASTLPRAVSGVGRELEKLLLASFIIEPIGSSYVTFCVWELFPEHISTSRRHCCLLACALFSLVGWGGVVGGLIHKACWIKFCEYNEPTRVRSEGTR